MTEERKHPVHIEYVVDGVSFVGDGDTIVDAVDSLEHWARVRMAEDVTRRVFDRLTADIAASRAPR